MAEDLDDEEEDEEEEEELELEDLGTLAFEDDETEEGVKLDTLLKEEASELMELSEEEKEDS